MRPAILPPQVSGAEPGAPAPVSAPGRKERPGAARPLCGLRAPPPAPAAPPSTRIADRRTGYPVGMDTMTLNLIMPLLIFLGTAAIMVVAALLMKHESDRAHR